jgi:acetoin:2,6-dichlorophenolindophenol oxidoreductase subunit alpha
MKTSPRQLVSIYRSMLKIRLTEESLVEPILNRTVNCPVHLCSGQEAVAVGICENLTRKDYIFGNHRSHGHYLAKGGDLNEMMAEFIAKKPAAPKAEGAQCILFLLRMA